MSSSLNTIVDNTAQPTRLAAYRDPYTLVNLSTTSTIWVGDDPGVQANGSAIRLAPLASVRRAPNMETYCVLDLASAGSPAPIVLAFGSDQYQDPYSVALALQNSGLILVDSPVSVIPTTNITGVADNWLPGASSLYDVRTLQSVILNYIKDGVHAHTVILTLQWYGNINATANDSAGADQFVWSSDDTASIFGLQLPVRGSYLRVDSFITGAGATDVISLLGSHRECSPWGRNLGTRIWIQSTNNIPASGTVTLKPSTGRYDGPASVGFVYVPGVAADNIDWQIQDRTNANVSIAAGYLTNSPAAAVLGQTIPVVLPRVSWQIAITNRGSTTRLVNTYITASPEGT